MPAAASPADVRNSDRLVSLSISSSLFKAAHFSDALAPANMRRHSGSFNYRRRRARLVLMGLEPSEPGGYSYSRRCVTTRWAAPSGEEHLVNGKAGISPEMAIRLNKAFGGCAETWLRLQMA